MLPAIAGTVFDVTAGRGFYGPGKVHAMLRGPELDRDGSVDGE